MMRIFIIHLLTISSDNKYDDVLQVAVLLLLYTLRVLRRIPCLLSREECRSCRLMIDAVNYPFRSLLHDL